MGQAHELVRAALRGAGAEGVHWQRLMAAMREVAGGGTDAGPLPAESVAVLRAVLEFRGPIALSAGSELPHSMPPAEMLRAHAVQALARADLAGHRDAIRRVADAPGSSERLAEIARGALRAGEAT
ncbi:MAG TPA: hypothetical protein VJ773_04790 [Gemmatimonadales bacterium]|nr:hypothetical protein [Gemmatimonadales bacterium]